MERLQSFAYQTLRRSERFFKTDMVYLVKGGSWMTLNQILSAISGLVIALVFANLLPKEVYGNYKYILSIAAVVGSFSLSGLGAILIQSVSRGYDGMLRYSFFENLKWSFGIVIVALAGFGYYFFAGNHMLAYGFLIVGALIPLMNSAQLHAPFLNGKHDFRRASLYSAGISFFQMVSLVSALLLFLSYILYTQNVLILVGVYFGSQLVGNLAAYIATIRRYRPSNRVSPSDFRLGKHLSFINIVNTIAGQLDKILLFHFLGAIPVAVYVLAQAPVVQMRGLLKLTTPLALPKLATRSREEIKKEIGPKLKRFTLAIAIMVFLYILFAPLLYRIAFPKYMDAVLYSQVYALILLMFPKKLSALALQALGERTAIYTLSTIGSVVQIGALVALVPFFGIWGAIGAELLSNLAANLGTNYFIKRL